MTNTTIATAIEMVINAGVTAASDIFAFVMDKANGVTVPMLEEALVDMTVAFKKKQPKEVKADFFARALEMDMDDYLSAAGESPVAETKSEEVVEVKEEKYAMLEDNKGRSLVYNNKNNERMLEKSKAANTVINKAVTVKISDDNDNVKAMLETVRAAADKYLVAVAPHRLVLENIVFYGTKKEVSREEYRNGQYIREIKLKNGSIMRFLGEVTVKFPKGYAQIKRWNKTKPNSKGTLGAPEFVDFVGYDVNLAKRMYDSRRPLAEGTGRVVLSIYEFEGTDGVVSPLQVSLPNEKGQDGNRWENFLTSDSRFIKTKNAEYVDQPLYLGDNNATFNAAITALVRTYTNEFVRVNPLNNHSYDKTNCSNLVRLQTMDGVNDDLVDSKKTRAVLQSVDTSQLTLVGPYQPNHLCTITGELIDTEAKLALNDMTSFERDSYVDEDGEIRFQGHKEVMWAGKSVAPQDVINAGIEKVCGNCPFFCGNSPKSEQQVGKEKVEMREKTGKQDVYVSPFYRAKAKPEGQAIETLVVRGGKHEWVLAYPGEFFTKDADGELDLVDGIEDVCGIRVRAAGMMIEASSDVVENIDPEFVAPVEAHDVRHADVMKTINYLFHFAFNMDKFSEEEAEAMFELADNKPEDLTDSESDRWDRAVYWIAQGIVRAEEREANNSIPEFVQKFFAGITEGVEEINVEDVMSERLEKLEHSEFKTMEELVASGKVNRNDYIHSVYDDLEAGEFVRYLDDAALDYVYTCILEGKSFAVVGGTDKDKELAAGALQEMLQRELNSFIRGLRRESKPADAFAELKLGEEAMKYISSVVGLK